MRTPSKGAVDLNFPAPPNAPSRLRARSRLYGFLSVALRGPELELPWALAAAGPWEMLHEAARDLDDPDVSQALATASQRAAATGPDELRAAYGALFGHGLRGAVPPYECEYGSDEIFKLSGDLADLGGFYSAFGIEIDPLAHERADHICAELEFMLLLCAKEASAQEEEGAAGLEHLAVVRDAQRKFLRDHLGRWGVAFARRLETQDSTGLLGAAGRLLEAFLVRECRRLNVSCGPALLPLRETGSAEEMLAAQACGIGLGVPGAAEERTADTEE